MLINIKVITRASENKIEKEAKGRLKAYLKAIPEKGKANALLIKLLADYYKVSKNQIKIIKGARSKNKIIKII